MLTFGAIGGGATAYASVVSATVLSDDDELFCLLPMRMAERGNGEYRWGQALTLVPRYDRRSTRRIGLMREALSVALDRPHLMVDVNEYWSPKQAVHFMHEIEKRYDITWIEELHGAGITRDWPACRAESKRRATAENLRSIGEVYPLIHNEAVDIVNVSTATTGFTGCRQVANMCYAYELPVSMMNCQANYMAHLAAAFPNHLAMEVVDRKRALSTFRQYN